VRIQGVGLEDHRDVAVTRGEVVDDAVSDPHLAFGDRLETSHHAQSRRLAAAGGSNEDHEFAVGNVDGQVSYRASAVGVHLSHVRQRQVRHARAAPSTVPRSSAIVP